MSKHPGDPRSDPFGEQPFDPHEYPNVTYTPPAPPPTTTNVLGFAPYRGGEQHGVPFQEPGKTYLPYASEEKAHRDYTDPTITPRDVEDIKPVQVELVANPTLISPRHIRFLSYAFAASTTPAFRQIIQWERFRKRVVVTAAGSAGGTATLRLSSDPDAGTVNSAFYLIPTGQQLELLNSEAQDGLYVWIVTATDATVNISVAVEYYDYDGSKLL